MNVYKVRNLQENDADYWLEMWQAYLSFYQTSLPEEVNNNTLKRLLSNDRNIGCFVACGLDNIPVGIANYIIHLSTWKTEPECYLQDLYVKPEHRKAAVARLLLEQLHRFSKERNCSQLHWITKPDNKVAQALYNKVATSEPWLLYVMN